jgi:hypothetical protein
MISFARLLMAKLRKMTMLCKFCGLKALGLILAVSSAAVGVAVLGWTYPGIVVGVAATGFAFAAIGWAINTWWK